MTILKFGNLPWWINHQRLKGFPEPINHLINQVSFFKKFCVECAGKQFGKIVHLLEAIEGKLKENPVDEQIAEWVDQLKDEISQNRLENMEPNFLSLPVDVFRNNADKQIVIEMDHDLLKDVMLQIFKNRYQLFRRYDGALGGMFPLRDLLKDGKTLFVCRSSFAVKLADHGFPTERIICMDFKIPEDIPFRKKLIFPFKIKKLDDLIP
ncbi:MAG: hypothetical protein FJ115_00100 [Deltaproteobacteria bacterium]|nr:hypothetical protein [Deltaproteobacteria bacterium]MBM4321930.1 hypothetical protein [Deltaproteobacteria bacterium]